MASDSVLKTPHMHSFELLFHSHSISTHVLLLLSLSLSLTPLPIEPASSLGCVLNFDLRVFLFTCILANCTGTLVLDSYLA
jgi:hypothetical protein